MEARTKPDSTHIAAEALDALAPGHLARARGVAKLAGDLEAPEPEPDTVRDPIPTEGQDIEDRAGRHTPGPWHVSPPTAQHPSQARVSALSGFVQIYDAPLTVETAANARLIAAAPELLDACRLIVKAHPLNGNTSCPLCDASRAAEAAIAKATGGAR